MAHTIILGPYLSG